MKKSIVFLVLISSFFGVALSCNDGTKTYREGAILYETHCESCHMADGTGLEALYPPLAQSDMLRVMGATTACAIVNGMEGKIIVNGVEYDNKMLPIKGLSTVEVTNIINYINHAWGNENQFVPLQAVQKALEDCSPQK